MAALTHFDDVGMDTLSLAGPLAGKLAAMRAAGFRRVMLEASDVAAHPGGVEAAVREVRASGLVLTGVRALRGFEGLVGPAHDYKVEVARALIEMCAALGCRQLLATASAEPHASGDAAHLARDLRKLATMAVPSGIRIAYVSVADAQHGDSLAAAAEIVTRADCPNLGLGIDSYPGLAGGGPGPGAAPDAAEAGAALEALESLDIERVFVVQLSEVFWHGDGAGEPLRVFPGQGSQRSALQQLVLALDRLGYRGPYSLSACNRDFQQLPPATVAAQGRRAAVWLTEDVLRRAVPLPHQLLQRRGSGRGTA